MTTWGRPFFTCIFIFLYLVVVGQEEGEPERKKRGVFSIGFHPELVLSSFEHFSDFGNTALLKKNYFASTSSYDRDGKSNNNLRNYFIGISAMYRFTDADENYWGFEFEYGKGNTASKYTNLNKFLWPTFGDSVGAWINWHYYRRFSFTISRAWGEDVYTKWYAKLKTSYVVLKSVSNKTTDFTEEWVNNDKVGGIWEGKFFAHKNITLMPEIGRQFAFGATDDILLQVGLSYQLGLGELYRLTYYSVNNNTKSKPNTITSKGNNLSLGFSLQVPVWVHYKRHKEKKPVEPPAPPLERQFTQNNLVFLIDVSVSMNTEDKLALLKQYIISMLDSLPPDDYISIVTFSGAATVVLNPTQVGNKEEIIEKLQSLTPHGSTNINRGLEVAYDVLAHTHIRNGNNRIIVATDGEFRPSAQTKQLVADHFKAENKVVLSVFHFTGATGKTSSGLSELSLLGGGNYSMIDENNITTKLEAEYKQRIK